MLVTLAKNGAISMKNVGRVGVSVDSHGKMPDVVIYYPEKNWLLLVESVTSHGPVDGKRHAELARLFAEATAGLVYVTAFPSRSLWPVTSLKSLGKPRYGLRKLRHILSISTGRGF